MKKKRRAIKHPRKVITPFYKQRIVHVVLGLFLIIFGVYMLQKSTGEQEYPFSFDECMHSKNKEVINYYPRHCKSFDGTTFIEDVKTPVDTSSWKTFDTKLGFSFLCPPPWDCTTDGKNYASIGVTHYSDVNTFRFSVLTSDNFTDGLYRHPYYTNPVAWYRDVAAKKEIAVKALPSTIKPVPGTDASSYPNYHGYELDKMKDVTTQLGKGVLIPNQSIGYLSMLVPLNENELIILLISPDYLYDNPLFHAIITSIQATN